MLEGVRIVVRGDRGRGGGAGLRGPAGSRSRPMIRQGGMLPTPLERRKTIFLTLVVVRLTQDLRGRRRWRTFEIGKGCGPCPTDSSRNGRGRVSRLGTAGSRRRGWTTKRASARG